jgi:hypothetical protein
MARSYKQPFSTDQNRGKPKHGKDKRIAAKAVRSLPEDEAPAKGSAYRKESCSWNIRDWSFPDSSPKARRK